MSNNYEIINLPKSSCLRYPKIELWIKKLSCIPEYEELNKKGAVIFKELIYGLIEINKVKK